MAAPAPEANDPRRALISEVVALQRGLEEINSKITSTHAENAALTKENETLSEYIDSLMANVAAMGAKITADKTSPSLASRMLGGRRARGVKVNCHLGELNTKPVARRSGSLSPVRHRSGSIGGGAHCCGSGPASSATTAPMQLASPAAVSAAVGGGGASPLRLTTPPSHAQPAHSMPPPPPPPAVARDPVTGRYGVGGQAPPPPPPRPPG